MALAQFTRQFWFPSGVLAASLPARVFPLTSNALASLWTDGTGTVPVPNPVTTDVNGTVTFWAEEGEYWIHIDDEAFRFSVGSPDIDLFETQSSTLSTGVISGGGISANLADPGSVDIEALSGYIVDEFTDQRNPVVTRLDLPAQTVPMDAGSLARTGTWWLIAADGSVIQQEFRPSSVQLRSHIGLGFTAQAAGAIYTFRSIQQILAQPGNQLADLMDALGPFSIQGNQITPNGANLSVNHAAGTMFARSFNHIANGIRTRSPHISVSQAQTPAQFRYITATGTVFGPLTSLVDVANFDNGGVITPIGGGSGASSIHRLWLFPVDNPQDQMAMQYGQTAYSSLSAAIDTIGQSGHVPNPQFPGTGALIAYIVATRTATNLSDPAQARIVVPGKFATP